MVAGERIESEGPALHAELSVLDAAALAIADRFETVARQLERLHEHPEGIREIHQLRVATRRAGAALNVLSPLLLRTDTTKPRQRLKKLRRAAGAVRSCDVQAALLEERLSSASPVEEFAIEVVLGRIDRSREKRRRRLADRRRRTSPGKIRKDAARLNASMRIPLSRLSEGPAPTFALPDSPERFGHAARGAVDRAAAKFAEACIADGSDFERLHNIRLTAKRLRYTLELCAPALDSALVDACVSALRKLQDRLGEINDRHELSILVDQTAEKVRPRAQGRAAVAFAALREGLQADRDRLRLQFENWWNIRRERLFEALHRITGVAPAPIDHRPTNPPESLTAEPSVPEPTIEMPEQMNAQTDPLDIPASFFISPPTRHGATA